MGEFFMCMKMAAYITVFKNTWQSCLEFRFNALLYFLVNSIALIGVYFLWTSIYQNADIIEGYTKQQMITYYLVSAYVFSAFAHWLPISNEISSGELSLYLIKPIRYIPYHFARTLSWIIFRFLIGFPILITLFFFFKDSLFIPSQLSVYIFFVITCLGSLSLLFLLEVLVNFIEFWVFGSTSVSMTTDVIIRFLGGMLIPLSLLPHPIQIFANLLPFKYTASFPLDVLFGKISPGEGFVGIGVQFLWVVVLCSIVAYVWRKGLKKYEATGG